MIYMLQIFKDKRGISMKVIIDRFEGPYAVCKKEDKGMMDIKRIEIPRSAKEGDILNVTENRITIERNEKNFN